MEFISRYYEGNLTTLGSPEMLQRLAQGGIAITSQTLRNWERDGLITPPERGGGYKGKWTKYSEFALAECYAAHMLLQVLTKSQSEQTIPKFSAAQLSKARMNCRFYPSGIEKPNLATDYLLKKTGSKATIREESIVGTAINWEDEPKFSLDNEYVLLAKASGQNSFETLLKFTMQLTAELLWFKYLTEGARKFQLVK